jgi:glycosyltransferase involved in cell wall biosynthesis
MRAVYSRQSQQRLGNLLRQEKPDVAYLHNIHHQLSLSILPILKEWGMPIVWRLHDYALRCPNSTFYSRGEICEACRGGRYYQAVLRACRRNSRAASLVACLSSYLDRLLRLADLVDLFVSPSLFLRNKMVAHGLAGERIVVQPNFVEPQLTQAGAGDDGDGDYLLYFGRLSKEKGVETLIRAVGRVPGGAQLRVVGQGPERKRLATVAGQVAAGQVTFTGYQAEGALQASLQGAAAVVVPSEWYENCPYAVLEAQAAGKAILASRAGGIPELVEEGRTGWLFEAGDAHALAGRIEEALSDRSRLALFGARARAKVKGEYGPERHYAGFVEICSGLL